MCSANVTAGQAKRQARGWYPAALRRYRLIAARRGARAAASIPPSGRAATLSRAARAAPRHGSAPTAPPASRLANRNNLVGLRCVAPRGGVRPRRPAPPHPDGPVAAKPALVLLAQLSASPQVGPGQPGRRKSQIPTWVASTSRVCHQKRQYRNPSLSPPDLFHFPTKEGVCAQSWT